MGAGWAGYSSWAGWDESTLSLPFSPLSHINPCIQAYPELLSPSFVTNATMREIPASQEVL